MVSEMIVSERLQSVFREVFDDDLLEVRAETAKKDITGWDSMADIKVILGVEAEYDVKFMTSEVVRLRSVTDIIDALAKRGVIA
jgi:acyl carrier protein